MLLFHNKSITKYSNDNATRGDINIFYLLPVNPTSTTRLVQVIRRGFYLHSLECCLDNTVKRSSVSLNHKKKPLHPQVSGELLFILFPPLRQARRSERTAEVKFNVRRGEARDAAGRCISPWRFKHDACFSNVSRWDSDSDPFLAVEFKQNLKGCSVKRFWMN